MFNDFDSLTKAACNYIIIIVNVIKIVILKLYTCICYHSFYFMCCPNKPLAKDFLGLIESFNLTQCVDSPTHQHGDLVLSCGLPVSTTEDCVASFSDHVPVLFEICLS